MLGNKGISIIICCYNSKDRLPNTIRHIANQVVENIAWELIIVDNNSSDATSHYALEETKKHDSLINRTLIIPEKNPGLSNARMCGVKVSQYDYIIFCDDDNWLEENYIQTAYEILENNIEIGALGGQSEAVSDVDFPDWFDAFKHSYAVGKQGKESFDLLSNNNYLVGAGIIIRKQVFNKIREKRIHQKLTDRIGKKIVGGGDVELCFLITLMGYKLAYIEDLKFKHYISPNRVTLNYLKNMWLAYPHSWIIFDAYKVFLNDTFSNEKLSKKYWYKFYIKNLTSLLKRFHSYIYRKIIGDVSFYLPFEVQVKYLIYGLTNTHIVTETIRDLSGKLRGNTN